MTIEKKIQINTQLTKLEKEIGNYIIKNKDEVLQLTIEDLANKLFVSKSAILRFCKKLEMSGYKQLKLQLALDIQAIEEDIDVNYPFSKEDDIAQIAIKMKKLYEEVVSDTQNLIDKKLLNEVAHFIDNSSAIDIYTHAHNLSVAINFQDQLLSIGKNTNCYSTRYNQRLCALHSNDKHLAIIISYSGKAAFMEGIVHKLKENNTPIIFIGKVGSNTYPDIIKHQLFISDKENLQQRISQFSSHISLQYLLDVLFSCIFNLHPDENRNNLIDKIQYMDDRGL